MATIELKLNLTSEELYILQFALAKFKTIKKENEIADTVLKKTIIAELNEKTGEKKNDRTTSSRKQNSTINNQASESARKLRRARQNKRNIN